MGLRGGVVNGVKWRGERLTMESVVAILREQVCSRLVGLGRTGGIEND